MTTWDTAEKLLCIRLDALGDVLMTTPAIRALKTRSLKRRVTLLASSAGRAAAELVPEIDAVIPYDCPWMKATPARADSRPDLALIERLRAERFDGCVIFTVYSQSPLPAALLAHLADIPLRLAHCRENPYQLLTHWVPDPEPAQDVRHEVQRQLDLVAQIGCRTDDTRLSLRVPDAARQRVDALLDRLGIDRRRPWVLLHPGASAPSRRYPPAQFAEAADRLAGDGCPIVLTAGAAERALLDEIRTRMRMPAHVITDALSLAELAALIAAAPVLLANNSGPAHIAAAVGTPVAQLYALTNPQHTPWQAASRVLYHDVACRHCYKSVCPAGHHDCLRQVPPARVVAAVRELLAGADRENSVAANAADGMPPLPPRAIGL